MTLKWKRLLYVLLSATLIAWYTYGFSQTDSTQYEINKAIWTISGAECLAHVEMLAGEKCTGRGTTSEGFQNTAQYIADQFRSMGLKAPQGHENYWQEFNVNENIIGDNNEFALEILLKSKKGKDTLHVNYEVDKDFLPMSFSSKCDFTAEVIVPGFGVALDDNAWDDYKGVDVRNKIVMVLSGVPEVENVDWHYGWRMRNKIGHAVKRGAKGFIVIGDPIGLAATEAKIPSMMISEKVANDILKGTGYTVSSLRDEINTKKKTIVLKPKNHVKMKVNSAIRENCETKNIIGYLPGSDPVLKNEYIVLGGHADHLGQIAGETFWGANDNASGTATVMEVAEAFCHLKTPPKRSIIFIAFTGEEMGLLGSKYYTEHPIFPLEKTRAMINLDMVGSGWDGLMIVGGHTFPEFAGLFDQFHNYVAFGPIARRWTSNNSDHYPFHTKGIPSVFLYAMGSGPTYHTPRDVPETLDPEVMESIGRIVFRVILEMVNSDEIQFKEVEH